MLSSISVAIMNQGDADASNRTFAAAVREGRARLGLSQRSLAVKLAQLGVTIDQASIARMESGQREPRLGEAIAIAEYLQFDILQIESGHPNVSYHGAMERATQRYFEARAAVADYLHAAQDAARQYKLWELGDPSSSDDGEFLAHAATLPGSEKVYGARPVDWRDLDWDWSRPYVANLLLGLGSEGPSGGVPGVVMPPCRESVE